MNRLAIAFFRCGWHNKTDDVSFLEFGGIWVPRQGLNREMVVLAAAEMIQDRGMRSFTMRELAAHMHVKAASLYNHIESMDALLIDVAWLTVERLVESMNAAIQGKAGAAAIFALAEAYMRFGKAHFEWYKLILSLPLSEDAKLAESPKRIIDPILRALDGFQLSDVQRMHQQRILRSIMHGFLTQEACGYFSHFPIDVQESYRLAIACFIRGLEGGADAHEAG